jgi:hypothetical protein
MSTVCTSEDGIGLRMRTAVYPAAIADRKKKDILVGWLCLLPAS